MGTLAGASQSLITAVNSSMVAADNTISVHDDDAGWDASTFTFRDPGSWRLGYVLRWERRYYSRACFDVDGTILSYSNGGVSSPGNPRFLSDSALASALSAIGWSMTRGQRQPYILSATPLGQDIRWQCRNSGLGEINGRSLMPSWTAAPAPIAASTCLVTPRQTYRFTDGSGTVTFQVDSIAIDANATGGTFHIGGTSGIAYNDSGAGVQAAAGCHAWIGYCGGGRSLYRSVDRDLPRSLET